MNRRSTILLVIALAFATLLVPFTNITEVREQNILAEEAVYSFNSNEEEKITTIENLKLPAESTFGSLEETAQWGLDSEEHWYVLEAVIENPAEEKAEIKFSITQESEAEANWEATSEIEAGENEISLKALIKKSAKEVYLLVENPSKADLNVLSLKLYKGPRLTPTEKQEIVDALAAEVLPEAQAGFRVLPYLQSPSSTGMTICWISETPTPGIIKVEGEDFAFESESKPEYQHIMQYTAKEMKQDIVWNNGNGEEQSLEKGSWLLSNDNYRHVVRIEGLEPATEYKYSVKQDDVEYKNNFRTFPEDEWDNIRIIAFSDTETEPRGRLENREWGQHPVNTYVEGSEDRPALDSEYGKKFGQDTRNGVTKVRYPLDQMRALVENTNHIIEADPDLLLLPGDLVQGGGYQPAWDEFWRHFAGEFGELNCHIPMVSALGNWETFAAINGGYGSPEDPTPAAISRLKYHAYIESPGDPEHPQYLDSYHRTDLGPITILTLDSTKGNVHETNNNPVGLIYGGNDSVLNESLWATQGLLSDPYITTDTQGSFTNEDYDRAFTMVTGLPEELTDLPRFNPGSDQWNWVEEQLKSAREEGQIIIVQFHHCPYSSGVHGAAPNFEYPDNQSGVAMRVYSPLFEKYGVSLVLSGHDEMYERSFVDLDGDGKGFHVYDVGVAADGLRTEKLVEVEEGKPYVEVNYNTYFKWSATENEPEDWQFNENGVLHLVDGGIHYGHLQMDFENLDGVIKLTINPVYIFPILDDNYDLIETERRIYHDVVEIYFDENGVEVPAEELAAVSK